MDARCYSDSVGAPLEGALVPTAKGTLEGRPYNCLF